MRADRCVNKYKKYTKVSEILTDYRGYYEKISKCSKVCEISFILIEKNVFI
jgi:hypothetical protein